MLKINYFAFVFSALLFSFNVFAQDVHTEQIPEFHQVNENIWRGGRPQAGDLEMLANQNIRTIINVENNKAAVDAERAEAARLGLNFISIPMSGFWTPKNSQVTAVLEKLNDPSLFPIYLHCQHGQDRTGLLFGLYRVRHDNWTPQLAYQEMRGYGFHRTLFLLDHYYKSHSGYKEIED